MVQSAQKCGREIMWSLRLRSHAPGVVERPRKEAGPWTPMMIQQACFQKRCPCKSKRLNAPKHVPQLVHPKAIPTSSVEAFFHDVVRQRLDGWIIKHDGRSQTHLELFDKLVSERHTR